MYAYLANINWIFLLETYMQKDIHYIASLTLIVAKLLKQLNGWVSLIKEILNRSILRSERKKKE